MSRNLHSLVRIALIAAVFTLVGSTARTARAADPSVSPSVPAATPTLLPQYAPKPITMTAQPIGPQTPPSVNVDPSLRRHLEAPKASYDALIHQWSPTLETPPESVISERYIHTRDDSARSMSLKEAIYLSLRNNPAIQSASLNPLASLQSVIQSDAVFDPSVTSKVDVLKSVTPATSALSGATTNAFKQYDWNFGITKVLSTTNGSLGFNFNNNRQLSNSIFASINPAYTPGLSVSLTQPLLQNFGLDFATINVRISEINQKQSQFQYEQNLNDFVLTVASDYWNVVRAEENLAVAQEGLRLTQDLVEQNTVKVRVGVLAPLDLQEAQSENATNESNVYSAENTLTVARAVLRQDVMLNPSHLFLPEKIQPSDKPSLSEDVNADEEQSLELAMEYRPELASMRQMIQSLLLQVKFAENQTLPTLNFGGQVGLNSTAGFTKCSTPFGGPLPGTGNCTPAGGAPFSGTSLPFTGTYPAALNRIWGFSFYNYAAVLTFQRPLMNDAAQAALAQARIQYEQQRLLYRDQISQVVVSVEQALSGVSSGVKVVHATKVAADYAAESLRAEQERYRVGMADTHDLLQFQDTLINALGSQVNAQIDLEIARLSLRHAEGTLLRKFQINFEAEDPHQHRWYDAF